MGRLWSSLLPVVGRGGGGAAEDAPVSLLLHMFEGQAVVVALCADLNLRLWSVQVGVVCTCSVQVGVVWSVRWVWLVISRVYTSTRSRIQIRIWITIHIGEVV